MREIYFRKRLALFALLPLIVAACGQGVQISLDSRTGNTEVNVNYTDQKGGNGKALKAMESRVFDTVPEENCAPENSSYAWQIGTLIGAMNTSSKYQAAVLMEGPPRVDGTIAVYLCDGLGSKAYTLHKSVFISNSFLGKMEDEAFGQNRGDLLMPAIGFVLFHEIGHAALGHSAEKMYDAGSGGGLHGFDILQETEADQFAFELMADLGLGVLGYEGADLARSLAWSMN